MKTVLYFFLLLWVSIGAQEPIEIAPLKTTPLKADSVVGVDNFGTIFFTQESTIYKKNKDTTISYNNLQLGKLTSANSFNPLKINVFYQEFNTVIILDNRLAEIFKVDFNTLNNYKNVSHISTGYDNTIWIFNQDTQLLEVFDYKTRTTKAQTLKPIDSPILDLTSNYNYAYLLTEDSILVYNYFGSLVKKIKNAGFTEIVENNESLYLKKENGLFYLAKDSTAVIPVKTNNNLVPQFFVTNETLYIYNFETLQEFRIKN
ncbi:hypothetical protein SAMN05421824_0056 [Hyunsoonleella jejuensis]|uniref:Uncharacterized protein n=1 Tax=Hyunsoonleella jejuensis TaxID=419940 RepID=A0A1H8ZVZ6_9FLAO|nr:hypothetical protein [Hyunsoonleella jejuensis]SEP68620.1 hypothetical protein SAMN05421824_0056 [Hyunsoonleella jejuensis]